MVIQLLLQHHLIYIIYQTYSRNNYCNITINSCKSLKQLLQHQLSAEIPTTLSHTNHNKNRRKKFQPQHPSLRFGPILVLQHDRMSMHSVVDLTAINKWSSFQHSTRTCNIFSSLISSVASSFPFCSRLFHDLHQKNGGWIFG